ncbi:aspartyl-phosphate phosphatase Spo0E family protein [Paenisporosarcina sp. OV554]|uniref:aspartyl-phosphate phosphatase Spo0E family protein n=1 Tax=Paenisporosarcina sp. OV554 TaxID=2135694 RepID=UPI000D4C8D30|nr:aspartyl-phosphate phosphatase Spo0E family protein [Paenisporosarcina sp. OV554]PUB10450.1 Spo0E like sporulation regulatory protein [Paenisporosarcina sp. OV554]
MAMLLQQVTQEIEEKKNELFDIYKQYGFLHSKTIQCSQELDKLLNQLFNVRHVGVKY